MNISSSTHPVRRASDRWSLWFLVAAATVGLLFVLVSRGDRNDGIYFSYAFDSGDLSGLIYALNEASYWLVKPLIAPLAKALGFVGVDFAAWARCLMAATVVGLAYESYRLAREGFSMTADGARWVAALTFVFPGYVLFQSTVHVLAVFVWLGMWGHRWWWRHHVGLQVTGLCLVGLSFQINSMFVFVLGLEALRWLLPPATQSKPTMRRLARTLAFVGFVLSSFALFKLVAPPQGLHAQASYNQILLPNSVDNIRRLVVSATMWSTWLFMSLPTCLVVAFLAIWQGARLPRWSFKMPFFQPFARRFLGASFLCGSAVFAYIAVGKFSAFAAPLFFGSGTSVYASFVNEFSPGWFTSGLGVSNVRHTMVLGAALSILIVVVTQGLALFFSEQRQPADTNMSPAAAQWVKWGLAFAVAHQGTWGALAHSQRYLQSAQDESVVLALKGIAAPPGGATVELRRVQSTKFWYDTVETNYLLFRAYGRTAWMGSTSFSDSGFTRDTLMRYVSAGKSAIAAEPLNMDRKSWFVAREFTDRACIALVQVNVPSPTAIELVRFIARLEPSVRAATVEQNVSNCPG